MDFALTDEQVLLIRTVRAFVYAELAPHEAEIDRTGVIDPDVAKQVHERSKALGLYALNVPERFGGGGLCHVDRMLVEEQFGRTSDVLVRRAFGNVYEVLFNCTDAQARRWLIPSASGDRVGSIAITEPEAGSDAASIKTRAIRSENGSWRLSGAKHFISDGLVSDYFIVSAVTTPGLGHRGISLFLVDRKTQGVTVGRDQPMMGLRGTSHTELFFDDVELDAECILGDEGTGMRQILTTLGCVRLAQVGARAVGKATLVLEKMTAYAAERVQFGRPIGDQQMVQQMIADSVIDVNTARLLVHRAAWDLDQGGDGRNWIAMVKVHAAEMVGRVTDRAVQVFGGMGYCKDLSIERYYRDARIARIYDGASEVHRMTIARNALRDNARLFDVFA